MAGHKQAKRPIEEIRAERVAAETEAQRIQAARTIPDDWKERSRRLWTPDQQAELMDEIIERMIAGQSIQSIGRMEHMPTASKIVDWFMGSHSARERYVRAREICAELFANEIVAISDNLEEDPNSRRVRIEARKWVATRILPKTYGDKIEVIETGKTIPSGHLMDLVQVSDSGADTMLLLEQVVDVASGEVIENESSAEQATVEAETKKSPGTQGTRG